MQIKIFQEMFDGKNFTMLYQREQKLFWLLEIMKKFGLGNGYILVFKDTFQGYGL